MDVQYQLLCRSVKFVQALSRSCNPVVRTCVALAIQGSRSAVSSTISAGCAMSALTRHDLAFSPRPAHSLFLREEQNDERAALIRDMLFFLHSMHFSPRHIVDTQNVKEIIAFLCTE